MINELKAALKRISGVVPWQENTALQQKMISNYISSNQVRKIQFGCGPNYLPGWLNTDIYKTFDDVTFLDITKQLPLPSNSFDYMTSEHLIEHITFPEGLAFLKECMRVLRPNGKVRITTPNLETILKLYNSAQTKEKEYIDHIVQNFIPQANYNKEVFVINNAFRNWGHQFLFDKATLINLLSEAGFSQITEVEPGVSGHPEFADIDVRNKSDRRHINRFEVMVFEAIKP